MNGGLFCSWALLFVIFAVTKFPLRSSFTHAIAGLIAVEVSLLAALSLYSVRRHWIASGFVFGPVPLLVDAIEFAPWALMLLFLLTIRREGGAVRPISW
ncbi:MAG TPA: hypothetical protein VN428_21360 [Bryobacteraceae bacterium]|nr:hypothetical protein [Bryobacteraceae bacterium]